MQAKVDALGCQSFEEFKEAVHRQFQAVPSSMLINLFNSMKGRIACVVEKQGDKTGY